MVYENRDTFEKEFEHIREQTQPGNLKSIAEDNACHGSCPIEMERLLEIAYECEEENIEETLRLNENHLDGSLFNCEKISQEEAESLIEDRSYRERYLRMTEIDCYTNSAGYRIHRGNGYSEQCALMVRDRMIANHNGLLDIAAPTKLGAIL